MVAKKQERNIITYSSLIAAADRAGRWEEGLTIWGHMAGGRCHPNLPAYNSAVSCCAQGLLPFSDAVCAPGPWPNLASSQLRAQTRWCYEWHAFHRLKL